jgi:hypothetical protein
MPVVPPILVLNYTLPGSPSTVKEEIEALCDRFAGFRPFSDPQNGG